jgi:hypothetical protein
VHQAAARVNARILRGAHLKTAVREHKPPFLRQALALLRPVDLPLVPQREGAGGRGRSGVTTTMTSQLRPTDLPIVCHLKVEGPCIQNGCSQRMNKGR